MDVPPLPVPVSNYLGLNFSTTDNEDDKPRFRSLRPTSDSPPHHSLPTLHKLSLDPHINILPMLNSNFSPAHNKEDKSTGKGYSETTLEFNFTVPCAFLTNAEERRIYAEIALKYYNKENAANYHLVDAFLSNGMSFWYGSWLHCNFTAKPPALDISPKLFFAEICVRSYTVRSCSLLDGASTVGCNLCSNVVHPTHEILNEEDMIDRDMFSPDNKVPCPDAEKRRRQAEAAVKYYNKKNAANFEVVDAFLSTGMLSYSGSYRGPNYFHCNFLAKPYNSEVSPTLFFAEYEGKFCRSCVILEGKTTVGCSECTNVVHPTGGFHFGGPQIEETFTSSPSYSPSSAFGFHFRGSQIEETFASPTYGYSPSSAFGYPSPYSREENVVHEVPYAPPKVVYYSNPHVRYAVNAMEYFNRINGANYELVDTLHCCDLLSEGMWYHINFTAKLPNGDISPKLFFAEIYGYHCSATACFMLEGEAQTVDGCIFCCSEMIHPTHGFLIGRPKQSV